MSIWSKIPGMGQRIVNIPPDENEEKLFAGDAIPDDMQAEINKLSLKEREDNHELRQKYLDKLFRMIKLWLFFNAFIILAQGITLTFKPYFSISFMLERSTIIAVLTTTTATVLGLFGIAARWLFPRKGE